MPSQPRSVDPAGRYSRQVLFSRLGKEGQERLAGARVLLVGLGALGSWSASILARAGVGSMVLVDRDIVELNNLQRQLLYTESDVGEPKALAAARHLRQVNSEIELLPVAEDFGPLVYESLPRPDLILDGTDNFPTRYLINDLAARDNLPWIYAGAVGSRGTAMAVLPGETPCLRCVLPDPPTTGETETCETVGVLAPAVASITAFQTTEALKILSGNRDQVSRGMLTIDVWQLEHALRFESAKPSPQCPTCTGTDYPALRRDWSAPVSLCGRDAVQVRPRASDDLDLGRLATNLANVATDLQLQPHLLRFTVEGCRFSVFPSGRALLFGVSDPDRAQVLFDRYVGA